MKTSKQPKTEELIWEQTNVPYGGVVPHLHLTPEGRLYAGTLNLARI